MTPQEETRLDCLAFLAARPTLSFTADAVERGLRREGSAASPQDVREALELLTGLDLATASREPLGSTYYYQATAAGVLHHERGR